MAHIGLSAGGAKFSPYQLSNPGILGCDISYDIETSAGPYPYARDAVNFHGTFEELRAFAVGMLAALDSAVPQPAVAAIKDRPDEPKVDDSFDVEAENEAQVRERE